MQTSMQSAEDLPHVRVVGAGVVTPHWESRFPSPSRLHLTMMGWIRPYQGTKGAMMSAETVTIYSPTSSVIYATFGTFKEGTPISQPHRTCDLLSSFEGRRSPPSGVARQRQWVKTCGKL